MGCQNTYITGYVGTGDIPLIGIIKDRSGGQLQIAYYEANDRNLYEGELFTCCGGGSISYSGCEAYITGFVGASGEVLLSIVSGLDGGLLDVEYFDMDTNAPYTGEVSACCTQSGGDENAIYEVDVTATAGTDITVPADIDVVSLAWNNLIYTMDFTQVGTTVSLTAGSFSDGDIVQVYYKKI